MPRKEELSADEQKLNDVFEEHLRSEFLAHSADQTMETMVANPRINEIPVMIGGDGREEVHEFYAKYFLPQIPPDAEIVPVSRTIGQERLVDEMIFRFTHTVPMDWMLPGVAPTGKRVEMGLVVIVQFNGDKMLREHFYWDQASVLVQLGLIEPKGLPVVGGEGARSVLDRGIPLNELLRGGKASCVE